MKREQKPIEIKNMAVTHHCIECGAPFEVMQGSRKQYCDKCLALRVSLGRPRKVNVKPLELNKDKLNEIKDLIPRK